MDLKKEQSRGLALKIYVPAPLSNAVMHSRMRSANLSKQV